MQILLASAKIMNAATSVDIPMKSKPKFQEQAGLFALELSTWDTNRLMKELKCSQAIALENQQRYQSFWNEEELLPSILAYYGQAYKYLQADNLAKMILLLHKIISSSPLSYMVCCVLWI